MAQRSTRWENQIMDKPLEHARLNWTRSAKSHTGPRLVERRIRARTHVSIRPQADLFEKFFVVLIQVSSIDQPLRTEAGLKRNATLPPAGNVATGLLKGE